MNTEKSNVKSQIPSIYRRKSWNSNFRDIVFIIEFEEIICFTVGGSTERSDGRYSKQRSNYCGGRSVQEKSRIGGNTLLTKQLASLRKFATKTQKYSLLHVNI